jgi:hypothetical protein
MMNTLEINTEELCSRKLWQLVSGEDEQTISENELTAAVAELEKRRHYLEELQEIGKLATEIS